MKNLGVGTLAGGLLTAPLMGIMYLFDEMLGLPFVPFDLFDWMTRVLPGPIVTFGIDLMIDILRQIGVSVADPAVLCPGGGRGRAVLRVRQLPWPAPRAIGGHSRRRTGRAPVGRHEHRHRGLGC